MLGLVDQVGNRDTIGFLFEVRGQARNLTLVDFLAQSLLEVLFQSQELVFVVAVQLLQGGLELANLHGQVRVDIRC